MKTKLLGGLALVLVILFGIYSLWHRNHPTTTTTNPVENVRVVTIDRPVLTIKEVDKIITDPTQKALINAQIKQINDLKLQVISLTSTIANNQINGGIGINEGTITIVPEPSNSGSNNESKVASFNFKDFQLSANYDSTGSSFKYDLNQSFVVTTTTGKRSDGSRLTLVDLTQLTPTGVHKIPATTTEINANEQSSYWFISPRIQGGFAIPRSGVIALQWLKHGSTTAAEDTKYAVLSPGLTIGSSGVKLVVLPISYNLGRIKHNPFTNLWVGPTIDINKSLGLSLTATF